MKIGLIVSIIVVALVALLAFVNLRGFPDSPTSATSPEKLEAITLPADLPPLVDAEDTMVEANPRYEALIEFYDRYEERIDVPDLGDVPGSVARRIVDMSREAADAAVVEPGLLDQYIPLEVGSQPEYGAAIEIIPMLVRDAAIEAYADGEGDIAEAIEIELANFALGERMFRHSVRLYNRWQGLQIMRDSVNVINQLVPELAEQGAGQAYGHDVTRWVEPVDRVYRAFEPKFVLVSKLDPHIGDITNIARNDEDPTFRIAALLKLGIVKFAPGHRGNERLIAETLEQASQDENPLIREAAEKARSLTREEMRRMR